jgi:ATP-dependent DNA helicase RecQ
MSPLLSLMRDQVRAAHGLGVRAATLHRKNRDDWTAIKEAFATDAVGVLLVSPERKAAAQLAELGRRVGALFDAVIARAVDEQLSRGGWLKDLEDS